MGSRCFLLMMSFNNSDTLLCRPNIKSLRIKSREDRTELCTDDINEILSYINNDVHSPSSIYLFFVCFWLKRIGACLLSLTTKRVFTSTPSIYRRSLRAIYCISFQWLWMNVWMHLSLWLFFTKLYESLRQLEVHFILYSFN